MKRIHFRNYNSPWNRLLSLLAGTLMVIVILKFSFDLEIPGVPPKAILVFGYLLMAYYFMKHYWWRNFVVYNSYGIRVKLNSWFEKAISFHKILSVSREDQRLICKLEGGKSIEIDTSNVFPEDVEKLEDLLRRPKPVNSDTIA